MLEAIDSSNMIQGMVLLMIVMGFMIFTLIVYVYKQSRWYHTRALEMFEMNRHAIVATNQGHIISEEFYRNFDYEQSHALPVPRNWLINHILEDVETCPVCGNCGRCPPTECIHRVSNRRRRRDKGKERVDDS